MRRERKGIVSGYMRETHGVTQSTVKHSQAQPLNKHQYSYYDTLDDVPTEQSRADAVSKCKPVTRCKIHTPDLSVSRIRQVSSALTNLVWHCDIFNSSPPPFFFFFLTAVCEQFSSYRLISRRTLCRDIPFFLFIGKWYAVGY